MDQQANKISEVSYVELQNRFMQASTVHLCPTMDIVAVILHNNQLVVLRIFTWERVLIVEASDIVGSSVTMKDLRFSPNGKYLSVLFTSNEIALINVELGKSFLSFPSGEDASGNVCVSFEWTKLETVGPFDDFAIGSSLNFLFEKFGMKEYQEAGVGDQSDKLLSFSEVYGDLERCLLLTLCNTGTLVAYSYGIFPLFTVNLQKISRSIRSFSGLSRSPSGELLGWIGDSANNKIAFETCAFPLFIAKNISKLERFASLAIYFEDAIARFREMILVCGRKWKESTKTIIPKLMLMKSLLDGYEIAMNPVEFMYSISVCGLWHPAAVNAFTQHWNDQGLLRLKFSIDATSKFVLSTLQLRCFPLLTNLILYISELLPVCDSIARRKIETLISALQNISLLLEITIQQVRIARDHFFTFIAFVKEKMRESTDAAHKIDATPTGDHFRSLFDPSKKRAAWIDHTTSPEILTATSVFSLLGEHVDSKLGLNSATLTTIKEGTRDIEIIEIVKEMETCRNECLGAVTIEIDLDNTCILAEVKRVSLVVKEVFAQGESATEISTSNLLGSPSQRIDQIDQIDLPIQDSTGSDSLNLNNFVFTTVNGDTNDVDAGYISAYKLDKEKILVVLKAAGSIHSSIVHIRLDEENGCSENISIDALKIYERKSEHSHNISLVVCTSTINGESFHLWRIDINHLPLKCLESFSLFDLNSLPRLELPGSKKSFASYKYGPIGILSPATAVFVEGTRGLVLILDRSNKMVVVDIETEEDTSEAASDFSE